MKNVIAYFRKMWLRHRWRSYFGFFLKQGLSPADAVDRATESVSALVHCFGLAEDVLPSDPLLSRLSSVCKKNH